MLEFIKNLLGGSNATVLKKLEKTVKQVDDLEEAYKKLSDDELRAKVRAKVNSLFGADALIDEVVNPVILGGIVIEGAGQRYDASVRAQLASIRTSLASAYAGGEE